MTARPSKSSERFPEQPIPAAKMIGNPSRFINIYVVQPETIELDGSAISAQTIEVRTSRGITKSFASHARDPHNRRGMTIGTKVRTAIETLRDGPTLKMGTRLIYDARAIYNGNVAHLLGNHAANLGYAKEKLGIGTKDCTIILERKTPALSSKFFNFLGYETCETNRAVEAEILDVDVDHSDPYHLSPYVANVVPDVVRPSGRERIFIARRSSRRLSNERELTAITEELGYTTCYFEDIALDQQWALVRDARSIISIHGAALGFLSAKGKPGSEPRYQLLEIFSPGLVADIFRKHSAVLGGHWVGCRGRLSSDFVKLVDESPDFRSQEGKDFFLHPDALHRALKTMGDLQPQAQRQRAGAARA